MLGRSRRGKKEIDRWIRNWQELQGRGVSDKPTLMYSPPPPPLHLSIPSHQKRKEGGVVYEGNATRWISLKASQINGVLSEGALVVPDAKCSKPEGGVREWEAGGGGGDLDCGYPLIVTAFVNWGVRRVEGVDDFDFYLQEFFLKAWLIKDRQELCCNFQHMPANPLPSSSLRGFI